jgi:hypothetical protein
MTKTFTKKVPGGKLLNAHVSILNDKINVKITGDFFLHPENSLYLIEDSLNGLHYDITPMEIGMILKNVVDENNIQTIGFTISDLADCIFEAILLNEE